MTLLEIVSTRLARVSLAATVDGSTPQTKEATHAPPLAADELAAAARGLSFGVAAAPEIQPISWRTGTSSGSREPTAATIASRSRSRPLAHAMWRSWHASGWGGVLDEIPAALQPKIRLKRSETDGFSAKDFDRGSTHAAASWNAARGPVRGERATSTFLAIALVATHGGMDGVVSETGEGASAQAGGSSAPPDTRGAVRTGRASPWSGPPWVRSPRRRSRRTPPPRARTRGPSSQPPSPTSSPGRPRRIRKKVS